MDFNRDIRPILSDTCFKCHGPDEKQRMANLRLDDTEGLFTDRGGYRIIVPGNAAQSKLYQKISTKDESILMPPTYSGRSLTPQQIELIKEWIDQGAKWEMLWSFVPPKRPPVPEVKDKDVAAQSHRQLCSGAPRIGRARSLLPKRTGPRCCAGFISTSRACLQRRRKLTPLLPTVPPTPTRSAWTSSWLPPITASAWPCPGSIWRGTRTRTATTLTRMRDMWAWRDWVIKAFNQNMPYDQFTIEQIAGDLLPNATMDQKIASGFNRNHMITLEGGAIPEEYHVEYVVDRVSTTSTAFLGLTMGCARCHDHKFDPITQKDFYRFFAFFNTVPERGLDGFTGNAVPVLPMPSHEQQQQLDALKAQIASTLAALPEKDLLAQRNEWQKTALASLPEPTREGLTAYYPFDGDLTDASGFHHDGKAVRGEVVFDDEGAVGQGRRVQPRNAGGFRQQRRFRSQPSPFPSSVWARPSGQRSRSRSCRSTMAASTGRDGNLPMTSLSAQRLQLRVAHIVVRLANHWPDDAIEVQTKERVPVSKLSSVPVTGLHQIAVEYDGSGKASGIKFYVSGKQVETEILKDHLSGNFRTTAPAGSRRQDPGNALRRRHGRPAHLQPHAERQRSGRPGHSPAGAFAAAWRWTGGPTAEIATLQPEKPPEEVQIGEEDKAKTKEEMEKALEKDRQARLSEYFLKYAAPEKERQLYAQLKICERKRPSWKTPSPRS